MNNQEKRIRKDFKKEKRVYISSWVIFVYYIRGLYSGGNKNIWRYLPLFATTKNDIIRLFVLFCGLIE